jgi:hypothetical protein
VILLAFVGWAAAFVLCGLWLIARFSTAFHRQRVAHYSALLDKSVAANEEANEALRRLIASCERLAAMNEQLCVYAARLASGRVRMVRA